VVSREGEQIASPAFAGTTRVESCPGGEEGETASGEMQQWWLESIARFTPLSEGSSARNLYKKIYKYKMFL
jgi:hypothetical protein